MSLMLITFEVLKKKEKSKSSYTWFVHSESLSWGSKINNVNVRNYAFTDSEMLLFGKP